MTNNVTCPVCVEEGVLPPRLIPARGKAAEAGVCCKHFRSGKRPRGQQVQRSPQGESVIHYKTFADVGMGR